MLIGGLCQREVAGGDVKRARLMVMQRDAVGALERLHLDLRLLDRAQVDAPYHPALEENVVETVAGAHHDIGAVDGVLRLRDRRDLDAERVAHLRGKSLPMFRIGTEAADQFDLAHRASRHELRPRLPAGAENADRARILAREIFDAEAVGGADPHALHDAVRHDRQRLAVLGREQEHQPGIAGARRGGDLLAPHVVALLRERHDVGIDADGADAELGDHAVHRLEAVDRVRPRGGRDAVRAGARDAAPFRQFDIGLLHDRDAVGHGQERLDIVVG